MDWITIIQNAIDDIEEHLQEKITVENLSERQHVSSFYFQKMFSTMCDCTVGDYIRNRRLSMAAKRILETEEPILDIALRYQYDSAEGFTRAFNRLFGVVPNSVRKKRCNLSLFEPITLIHKLTGGKMIMGDLEKRGYVVKETGAVYYSNSMDKTLDWFVNVLGWYGQVEARDEEGNGTYGCVNNIPMEIEALHIAPFTGIHLFKGKPSNRVVGFMLVKGVQALYDYVTSKGWNEISKVKEEPWGGKTVSVTTIDGSILTFFETP